MKRFILFIALFAVACTQPSYPGIDRPSGGGNTAEDQSIIDYIDQRLEAEYYWLDEVATKVNTFNRNVEWDNYLSQTLGRLESNADDGYINSKGQRVLYSYIREYQPSTRAQISGFGIELHYTIAVIDKDNNYYGFFVESVYPDSPAAEAGIKRGDVITMIGDSYITPDNYSYRFTSIQSNTAASLKLKLRRQTGDKESLDVELAKGTYSETPVVYNEIIEVEGYEKKIGYLVYTSFDAMYDEELLSVISDFATQGVGEVILDLRCNGGGSVASAVKLSSALAPATFEERVLCRVQRNPKNTKNDTVQEFKLSNTAEHLTNLERITVICSGYSASASELVVMGLRGLDFPVTLIGSTTEGKNCGMDVTRRKIGDINLEYAPITFMCFNAKGFGDWGEGITPDIDLTAEDNELGIHDKNFPLPRADWGDEEHDLALIAALSKITGKKVSIATRATTTDDYTVAARIAPPVGGSLLYDEE